MGQEPSPGGAPVGAQDPQAIRREIEEVREDLGHTVEALVEKADVKAHARERVEAIRSNPVPLAVAAGALVAGLIAWRLLSR